MTEQKPDCSHQTRVQLGLLGGAKGSRFSMPIPPWLKSRKATDPSSACGLVARLCKQIVLGLDPKSTSEQLLTLDPWTSCKGDKYHICTQKDTVEGFYIEAMLEFDLYFRKIILAVVIKID